MSTTQSILIIAYQFCPKGKVGTRRWSKFAKVLANRGYDVHVLCAKYPFKDKVNWCHDVENNPKIKIHRVKGNYPTALLKPDRNTLIKLFDAILRNTYYYIDAAQQWQQTMVTNASRLIKEHHIQNVFVTGAPFSCLYHAAFVKKANPTIQLILDYRDPWVDILSHIKLFPEQKKRKANEYQRIALAAADKVIFVTESFRTLYEKKFPDFKAKYEVIYNAFDEKDFQSFEKGKAAKKFDLIYPGEFIAGRIAAIKMFTEVLTDLDDDYIKKKLQVKVFSHNLTMPIFEEERHRQTFKKYFKSYKPVPQKEIFKEIANSALCFSINAPSDFFAFGAKTFDYMGLKKPIFHIGTPESELSIVLSKKEQYVASYSPDSIKNMLLKAKADFLNKHSKLVDYQDFNLESITDQVEELMV